MTIVWYRHMWSPHMINTWYEQLIRLSYTIIIYCHHMEWTYLIIMYGCHIWSLHIILVCDHRKRPLHTIDATHEFKFWSNFPTRWKMFAVQFRIVAHLGHNKGIRTWFPTQSYTSPGEELYSLRSLSQTSKWNPSPGQISECLNLKSHVSLTLGSGCPIPNRVELLGTTSRAPKSSRPGSLAIMCFLQVLQYWSDLSNEMCICQVFLWCRKLYAADICEVCCVWKLLYKASTIGNKLTAQVLSQYTATQNSKTTIRCRRCWQHVKTNGNEAIRFSKICVFFTGSVFFRGIVSISGSIVFGAIFVFL